VRDMHGATLTGGKVNSEEIFFSSKKGFVPNRVEFVADTQTAGSIGLLLQISLPCLLFAPESIKLQLKGGTNAIAAPQADYTLLVFKPIVEQFGIKFDLNISKRGFYPKGGGLVEVKSYPVKWLTPITITERGNVVSVTSYSFVSGVISADVADRISRAAEAKVKSHFGDEKIEYKFEAAHESAQQAFGEGVAIIIYAKTDKGCIIAGSALGEPGKKSEIVGEEAANLLITNLLHGGCVDEFLQDQLILFMALAKGYSKVLVGPLTLHTKTSILFAGSLTGAKFTVTEHEQTNLIECQGIGFENINLKSTD